MFCVMTINYKKQSTHTKLMLIFKHLNDSINSVTALTKMTFCLHSLGQNFTHHQNPLLPGLRVTGVFCSLSQLSWMAAGYILDKFPVHCRSLRDTQPFTLSHTPTDNLELTIDLTCIFLEPENQETTHADTGITCTLHQERYRPGI